MVAMRSSLLYLPAIYASSTYSVTHIARLTADDFDEQTSQVDFAVVKFQASWCGACQSMAGDWEEVAQKMGDNEDVLIADLDCPENMDLCKKLGIESYPTIKVFRAGKFFEDLHAREARDILGYIKKKSGPISKEISTTEEFHESLFFSTESIIIGFFNSADSLSFKLFYKLAEEHSLVYKFMHSFVDEVKSITGMDDDMESVMIARSPGLDDVNDDSNTIYMGGMDDLIELEAWIKANYFGTLPLVRNDQRAVFGSPQIMVYWKWDFQEKKNECIRMRGLIHSMLKDRPEILSKLGLGNLMQQGQLFVDMGLVERFNQPDPTVIGFHQGNRKYFMDMKMDKLSSWAPKFMKHKVAEFIKSEDLPGKSSYKPGAVWKLVGKNFRKIVMEDGKDVFLKVHTPWCGHCKKMAPDFVQLAEELKINENVIIAEIDYTKNTLPEEFPVRGYPTIFWVGRGEKDAPIKYDGQRTIAAWRRFINEHRSAERVANVRDEL